MTLSRPNHADVLVEGRGSAEHSAHIRDVVDRPTTDVVVKGRGADRTFSISADAVDRPTTDVLVKGRGAGEHLGHPS